MKLAVLTAGGDCPGLNAAIRAIVLSAHADGNQVVGIGHGFKGLAGPDLRDLGPEEVDGTIAQGGTILGASSFDPFREEAVDAVRETLDRESLDAIIVIGGEHSMEIARRLEVEHGLPTVGVPKTIDNDVVGTDLTFGFDTAVQIATEAIDRLHTTAESHDRVMVVEVMGRNTGWIALWSALAAGADAVLIPEVERTVPDLIETITRRHESGKDFSIVVVAEGATLHTAPGVGERVTISAREDHYGYERLGGIAVELARLLDAGTGFEVRATILGHIQRGGSPTSTDRVLATRLGNTAYEAVRNGDFGVMAALRGAETTLVPLAETAGVKKVDPEMVSLADRLGII
jgi:phosphofructokinase-like protein